jgi:large subunit ribosomal protein L1
MAPKAKAATPAKEKAAPKVAVEETVVAEEATPVTPEVKETPAAEVTKEAATEEAAPEKKKSRESTSEKAKKAAAARAEAGITEVSRKKQLDPLRKRGKKYREMVKLVDRTKNYPLAEALELAQKTSMSKFDGAIELHIKVKAEGVRGTVVLPHGTGKTKKVAVADDATLEALAAGKMDFDILLATPAQMPKLAKFAKVLGPKGLMPSPKAGTVTDDIEKVSKEIGGGRVEYRVDKNGVIHLSVGRVSFKVEQLVENVQIILALLTSAKVQTISVSATMGVGVRVARD